MTVLNDRTRLTDLVHKYHLTVPKALWGAFHFTVPCSVPRAKNIVDCLRFDTLNLPLSLFWQAPAVKIIPNYFYLVAGLQT